MSLKDHLKRFLGMDELETRLSLVENQKAQLEKKVIDSEKTKDLIRKSAAKKDLSERVLEEFEDLGLEIKDKDRALDSMEAVELAEHYGFRRYSPELKRSYPKAVITLKELREAPEDYWHKLKKGVFGFPLSLNFDRLNDFMLARYGNISIECDSYSPKSNNGLVKFIPRSILSHNNKDYDFDKKILQSFDAANLKRSNSDLWASIDSADFLYNFDGLVDMIKESPEYSIEEKKKAVEALSFVKASYLTAMEITGTSKIKDPSDMLDYGTSVDEKENTPARIKDENGLKSIIRDELLKDMKGTTKYDVEELVPIRSVERFRELASKRTSEILSKDKENKGLTDQIDKPLEDYSIGESVVLAAYFARNVIQKYESLDDNIKNIFSGKRDDKISGKCTDYNGLALQYLREFLVPLNPEKFDGWTFAAESEQIDSYRHSYMKIIHENPDKTFDVYFVDPTRLANKGISGLKTPKDIYDSMNTDNQPLEIQRDAEDFLYDPIE